MASNPPPNDELQRVLEAERARQQFGGNPNIPILGQKKSTRRWRCKVCGNTAKGMMVQLPEGLTLEAPEGQIFTMLPGEVTPVCLCVQCDVKIRRKLIPPMEEIDEDDNVILSGLRVVPPSDEGEGQYINPEDEWEGAPPRNDDEEQS